MPFGASSKTIKSFWTDTRQRVAGRDDDLWGLRCMSLSDFCLIPYVRFGVRQLRCERSVRVPQRRIDDRIRKLCATAQAASHRDLEPILQELLALVHQKVERLRRRAARLLLKGEHLEPERRAG
jgi:hypothetical protein